MQAFDLGVLFVFSWNWFVYVLCSMLIFLSLFFHFPDLRLCPIDIIEWVEVELKLVGRVLWWKSLGSTLDGTFGL